MTRRPGGTDIARLSSRFQIFDTPEVESMTFEELPAEWQGRIRKLRAENAKFRTERNTLRAALETVLKTKNGESK